jgi:cytoskeleton-associated protein 5
VTLSDLNEDIVNFSKHKNPQVKEQTMKFLVRCLRNTIHAIPKAELKSLSDVMLSGLEDAVVPVREIAAEGLGTLMKLVGKATFTPIIQGQDDLRKVKVEEYYEKAEVKYQPPKAKPKVVQAARPPSKAPVKKPAAKPPPRVISSPPPSAAAENGLGSSLSSKPPPARPAPAKKPSTAPPPKAAPPKKNAGSSAAPSGAGGSAKATEEVRYKMSQEEAEARAPDCLQASFIEGVGNSLWKTRLAALEELLSWIPEHADEIEAEVVVRYLTKKPGPKESNFQVSHFFACSHYLTCRPVGEEDSCLCRRYYHTGMAARVLGHSSACRRVSVILQGMHGFDNPIVL